MKVGPKERDDKMQNSFFVTDIMSELHNDFARLILGRVQEKLDNIFQGLTSLAVTLHREDRESLKIPNYLYRKSKHILLSCKPCFVFSFDGQHNLVRFDDYLLSYNGDICSCFDERSSKLCAYPSGADRRKC